MLRVIFLALGLCVALSLFAGCQSTVPFQMKSTLDENWGTAYESAKYNQILNPEAGKDLEPVEGMDADAAKKNVDKYRKSFQKKQAKETYIVNIGK